MRGYDGPSAMPYETRAKYYSRKAAERGIAEQIADDIA